jgi:hypothetical protein
VELKVVDFPSQVLAKIASSVKNEAFVAWKPFVACCYKFCNVCWSWFIQCEINIVRDHARLLRFRCYSTHEAFYDGPPCLNTRGSVMVRGILPADGAGVPHPWPQHAFPFLGKRDQIIKTIDIAMATPAITI